MRERRALAEADPRKEWTEAELVQAHDDNADMPYDDLRALSDRPAGSYIQGMANMPAAERAQLSAEVVPKREAPRELSVEEKEAARVAALQEQQDALKTRKAEVKAWADHVLAQEAATTAEIARVAKLETQKEALDKQKEALDKQQAELEAKRQRVADALDA